MLKCVILFALIVVLNAGCVSNYSSSPEPAYVKHANQIISEYAKETYNDEGLALYGIGGGFMHSVNRVTLRFESKETADVTKARKIYVRVAQSLINKFNRDEKIRPYLKNYPFTEENIEVSIRFNIESLDQSLVEKVVNFGSNVEYVRFSKPYIPTKMLHKETFAEAVRLAGAK